MRPVVAVEAPDATQRGRAAGSGLAQTADELGVLRPPVDARLLAGVDHQLLPQRQAALVSIGHVTRLRPRPAGAVADAPPLERHRRARLQTRTRSSVTSGRCSSPSSSASAAAIASPVPTEMIMTGTAALRPKNFARRRAPCEGPSTPRKTLAPAAPWRWSRSTTATNAGFPPARSWRPQ